MAYIISQNYREDGKGRWLVRYENEEPQLAVGHDFVQAVDVTFVPSSTYELSQGCIIVAQAELVFMDKAAKDIPEHAKDFWLSSEGNFKDWETDQVLGQVDQMFLGAGSSYLQNTDYPAEGSCVEIVRLGIWASVLEVGDRARVTSKGILLFEGGLGQVCRSFWTYCRPCKAVEEQEVVEEAGATPEGFFANPGHQPVPDGTPVEVIYRDGSRSISKVGKTYKGALKGALLQGDYYIVSWELSDCKADILYWRRVTEQELVAILFHEIELFKQVFFPPEDKPQPAQAQD